VNDAGHAVGRLPNGVAYLWDGTTTTWLYNGYAFGVNNSDVVVGNNGTTAFMWVNGRTVVLPANGPVSYAFDISDSGFIAGFSGGVACRWQEGAITVIGMLPGGTGGSKAYGVNDVGDVVGYSDHGPNYKAFLYSGGVLSELSPLPSNDYNIAFAINNVGEAVGYATDGGPWPYYAVLWDNRQPIDLQTRVYPPLGIDLETALDISDAGWIIGSAKKNNSYHVYLMRPAHAADVNCDGPVDVGDLLEVINAWGKCAEACPSDLDNNGQVDVDDLLAVINGWGDCA
jgi:probable HAF family extracellular repeat protein